MYIRRKMCHYTVPSLKEGISWFTLTSSNETKLMLTMLINVKCLSHWKNGQFHYSVFALFRSFGFSVFICSLSFLSLCSNIVKRPDISYHLVSIHHNGLEVFSCILVFGSGQLAFQLLPGVRLLLSPARSSQHFEHLLWVHLPPYLIYLLAVHIHHYVRRLQPKPYQQGRTNTHSCLTHSQPHWEVHHWPQHR